MMTPLQTLEQIYKDKISDQQYKLLDLTMPQAERAYLQGVIIGLQLAINEIPVADRYARLMAEMDREFDAHIGDGL